MEEERVGGVSGGVCWRRYCLTGWLLDDGLCTTRDTAVLIVGHERNVATARNGIWTYD